MFGSIATCYPKKSARADGINLTDAPPRYNDLKKRGKSRDAALKRAWLDSA